MRTGLQAGYSFEHFVLSSEMRAFFPFDVSLFVFVCIRRSKGGQVPTFKGVFEAD